jgi:hypothetical protein
LHQLIRKRLGGEQPDVDRDSDAVKEQAMAKKHVYSMGTSVNRIAAPDSNRRPRNRRPLE